MRQKLLNLNVEKARIFKICYHLQAAMCSRTAHSAPRLEVKKKKKPKNEKQKMATGPPKNVSRHPPFGTNTTRTPRDKKKRCGFPCVGKRIPPTRFQITTPQQFLSRKAKKRSRKKTNKTPDGYQK